MRRILLAIAVTAMIGPGFAADTAKTTLESDLAPEIAGELIATWADAQTSEPGFETFQALFTAFETVRKWEAYLEAVTAAKLPTEGPGYAAIKSAVESIADQGMNRVSVATTAIEKLAGVGDWHAADQAQAELVIDELSDLLTEITDPTQRITGQLVLASVELDSISRQAARARVIAAVRDLPHIPDSTVQLSFARELVRIITSLDDPQVIEVESEIVAGMRTVAGRATIADEIAADLTPAAQTRIAAATAADPLALAWGYHAARVAGSETDLVAAISALRLGIDPLPLLVLLSSGLDPDERRDQCLGLIQDFTADGSALRGLNLVMKLLPEDCPPSARLTLAAALAADDLDGVATPLIGDYLTAVAGEAGVDPEQRELLAATLVDLGALAEVRTHTETMQRLFSRTEFTAIAGRTAVSALLHDPTLRFSATGKDLVDAIAGYAPAGMMLTAVTGSPARPGAPQVVLDDADLALFREIGLALGRSAAAQQHLTNFLMKDVDLAARVALAEGITANPAFRQDDSELTLALRALDAGATATPHPALSVSLGTLDIASLPADQPASDDMILRAARQAAWAGDQQGAERLVANLSQQGDAALEIAAIGGVLGDFDHAVSVIRATEDTDQRVAAFRFLARERAHLLDETGWLTTVRATPVSGNVRVIRAATTASQITTAMQTKVLTVSLLGHTDAVPGTTPPVPNLDITSEDIARLAPYPVGGEGGVVVGGEGRYVRLARFESPSYDGVENNGVRDYVYQQNKTITPEFIFLNDGAFTIADVIDGIGRSETDAITLLPGGIVRINRPIAIGPDATLVISGAEVRELQLNGTLGAYIVNAGNLFILNTRVVGYDTDRNGPALVTPEESGDHFRPFILSWSGSVTNVAGTEFVAMGYSAGRSYGLSLISGPTDDLYARADSAPPTGAIVDNSFDNAYYGFYAYEADGVQVVGNEYRNSVIYAIDPHDRSTRLNLSLNATYGTFKKHGIIISREVDDSVIAGNLTFDNHGSGIMLDRASIGTVIAGNTVRNNLGDGIAIFESPCTLIAGNEVSFNQRSGILVRNSWDIDITHNRIESNESAAVQGLISDLAKSDGSEGRNFEVDPYQPFATLLVRGNTVVANGAGIQTAGVSATQVYDNHFRDQSKRLFGGDLDGLAAVLLQNSDDRPTTVATNCRPTVLIPPACPLTRIGAVTPFAGVEFRNAEAGDYCLGDPLSPQAQAFHGEAS